MPARPTSGHGRPRTYPHHHSKDLLPEFAVIIWVKDNWTAGDLKGDFVNQYECLAFIPKPEFLRKSKRFTEHVRTAEARLEAVDAKPTLQKHSSRPGENCPCVNNIDLKSF